MYIVKQNSQFSGFLINDNHVFLYNITIQGVNYEEYLLNCRRSYFYSPLWVNYEEYLLNCRPISFNYKIIG